MEARTVWAQVYLRCEMGGRIIEGRTIFEARTAVANGQRAGKSLLAGTGTRESVEAKGFREDTVDGVWVSAWQQHERNVGYAKYGRGSSSSSSSRV